MNAIFSKITAPRTPSAGNGINFTHRNTLNFYGSVYMYKLLCTFTA
jgi:hypothetical protein